MPFKSQAQRAKFAMLVKQGKMSQATFDAWQAETGDKSLPDRVGKKASKRAPKVRHVREAKVRK